MRTFRFNPDNKQNMKMGVVTVDTNRKHGINEPTMIKITEDDLIKVEGSNVWVVIQDIDLITLEFPQNIIGRPDVYREVKE